MNIEPEKTNRDDLNTEFFKKLSEKYIKNEFVIISPFIKNFSIKAPDLLEIIGLPKSVEPEYVSKALKYLEDVKQNVFNERWELFKWRTLAFLTIQDVFDAPFYDSEDLDGMNDLWYFYYEAKFILIEIILTGLNGFYISSKNLERLFLEFNLLQIHFDNTCRKQNSYNPIREYFKSNNNL